MENEKKQPKLTLRVGGVRAIVWENTNKENEVFNTIALERSYKDKDDKWQTTNTYRINDLPKLIAVLQEAFSKLVVTETKPEENNKLSKKDHETLN